MLALRIISRGSNRKRFIWNQVQLRTQVLLKNTIYLSNHWFWSSCQNVSKNPSVFYSKVWRYILKWFWQAERVISGIVRRLSKKAIYSYVYVFRNLFIKCYWGKLTCDDNTCSLYHCEWLENMLVADITKNSSFQALQISHSINTDCSIHFDFWTERFSCSPSLNFLLWEDDLTWPVVPHIRAFQRMPQLSQDWLQ